MLEPSDRKYLEVVREQPFVPIGWLYTQIYEDLRDRGLVVCRMGAYSLSEQGRQELEADGQTA